MGATRGMDGLARPSELEGARLRFGPFEADPRSGELWRSGVPVKLQLQPFKLLMLLATHPGELFTREELQEQMWPDGTTVQFNQSLNFCVKQVRLALDDQAAAPRYIETLPKRGYRWIAAVETVGAPAAPRPATAPVPFVARAVGRPAEADGVAAPATRLRLGWPALLAAALVGGVVAVASSRVIGAGADAPAPVFQRLTFRQGPLQSARFGPAGQVIYTAAWEEQPLRMFVVVPGSPEERPVEARAGRIVAVSEAGEIATLPADRDVGTLMRTPLGGGTSKELVERVMAADWTPDGATLAVARNDDAGIHIELPPGTVISDAVMPFGLRLSPDGERVAYTSHPVPRDDRGSVMLVDRAGEHRALSGEWGSLTGIAWSPGGEEVWFTAAEIGTDAALRAVSLDGRRERVVMPGFGRLVLHDTARDGRVLLERSTTRLHAMFSGGPDEPERELSWLDFSGINDISADGRHVLITESGAGGGAAYGVFLRATDGSPAVRLGTGVGMSLSPDGEWALAIPLEEPTRIDLLPTGPGEPREIRHPAIARYLWATWLPDGQRVLFTGIEADAAERVYVQEVAGGAPPRPVTPPGVGLFRDLITPDGSAVLAPCAGGGRCLYPIDGGEPRALEGIDPRVAVLWWDASGDALYVRPWDDPLVVSRLDLESGRSEPIREIDLPDGIAPTQFGGIVGTPDGRAIAWSYFDRQSELFLVDGLR